MSELLRKAVEKARILRARPHLKPVAAGGDEVSEAERWRTAQMAQDWLNANADPKYHRRRLPDMEENGQFKLLTRGRLGMRLKEFRYYQPPGGFYGNPYDKDFVQERQRERRNGLIKAGIVGAGLLGGGALLGRGLYKVGKSGAVRRAEDLAEELTNLRATKAAAAPAAQVAPAPRGRPPKTQSNTPPPAPPQTPAPTPPPQAPPAATKPQTPPPTGKAPKTKVVKDLNQSGDLPTADAAAEVEEITAAKAPRKLTPKQQKLAKRQAKVAKFAAAQSGGTPSVSSTPAPAAPVAVVPKTAPVAAKIETPAANTTKTISTKPVASATNEEFWESGGKKIPLTGTAAERAALRGELDKVSASDGFKGQTAGDVIDAARARATASLKNDFPPNLSAQLRAAGKENNPKPKAKRKSKESKSKKEADDADDLDDDLDEADDINEPDASPDEADWEAKLKENPQVRAKKTSAKAAAKAPAAKKPAASGGKKAKKEAAPLSFADKIAAKVKAKRDKKKNLSALLSRVRYFNQFQTDEAGIPLTGRVARDRFVKKLRDEDLDRRDANILRAGGAGALAGLLARGRIGASKRALIGAGAGGLGVISIRALTNNDRDIYGERNRGSKRAELIPAVGGLGAAAWLAGKRFKAFAKKFNHGGHGEHGGVKEFGSMSHARIMRKLKAHHSREGGHILISKMPNAAGHPDVRIVSERPSYVGWKSQESNLINKGAFKEQYSKNREDFRWLTEGKGETARGRARTWLAGAAARDAGLRGLKHFDDHRLYYFKGRNTGIAARSAEEARKKKKRGGDELVAVRTPSDSEKSQMARGVWVRTRRDGKSPQKSRYGKGRGQGPARKSLSAKLRVRFFEKKRFGPPAGFYDKNSPEYWNSPERKAEREVLRQENLRKENAQIPRHLRAQGWSWSGRWDGTKGGGSIYRDQDGKSHYIGKDGFTGFSARYRAIKFFEKRDRREKRELNPYVGAALSGFGSGAALGSLALLRRGATFRSAAKTAAKLGVASAGIVGGGALLGSKIVGDPRKEESAPFMKRAAIGGTLVGAGAGLGGALLLRRTSGGARALVAASKKSEPFSRPAMWLRKAPLAGAAGIGAVGGALYGGGMGLDEGQQVDSIRNLRKDMKNLSAKLRLFGRADQARWDATRGGGVQSNEDSQFANVPLGWATDRPMYVAKRDSQGRVEKDPLTGDAIRVKWDPSSGQLWNSIAREAKNKRVTVQRGGRLTRDAAAVLQGKERERDASGRIKKREWEKSWFHNKATEIGMTAAGLGGLATVRYANNNPDTKVGQAWANTQKSVRATGDGLSEIGKNILGGITKITAKKAFSAKLKRLRELDAIAEYEGWDIRDPRGKSARVFAPGSRRRERRQKEWHEKTENERKLWKAGIAAGVLGGAGAMLVGQRLVSGKSLIPSRFMPKKVTPPDDSVFVDASKVFKTGA